MHRYILSREPELDAARSHLETKDAVVITGPVGIGKSTFISRFGFRYQGDFPGGVLAMAVKKGFPSQFDLMVEGFKDWPTLGRALVVVDDPHRVELAELQRLFERIRGSHVKLLLAAQRDQLEAFEWDAHLDVATIELQPFGQGQLASLSKKMGVEADAATTIAEFSEGNPRTALLLTDYAHQRDPRQLIADLAAIGLPTVLDRDGNALDAQAPGFQAIQARVRGINDALLHVLASEPNDLYSLSPRRFEELIAELYSRAGYEVALTPASGDGGVDIYAVQWTPSGSFLTVIDCKRYARDRKVDVGLVRSLYGTVEAENASVGVLTTTSSFTKGAEDFQQERMHRIGLQDFLSVQHMLAVHRP